MATELPPEEHPWPDDDGGTANEPPANEPPVNEPPVNEQPAAEPPAAEVAAAEPAAAEPPSAQEMAGPPPAPAPGGVYAASAGPTDGSGILAPTTPAPRNRGRLAVVGALGVAAVIFFGKIALGMLTATAVSGVLGGVFGGPFEKVPSDQREQMEKRFDAAVGDDLKGLSDAEVEARVQAMLTDGLPRLADEPLVERMQLTVKLSDTADEATCARLARSSSTGTQDSDAVLKALGMLDSNSIARWYEINLSAIEANAAGSPAARTADTAEAERILGEMVNGLTAEEMASVSALYNGGQVPDADACAGFRTLYEHVMALPDRDVAIMALYDVSP
jgi:hypothetical protein